MISRSTKTYYFVAETAALNSEEFLSCGPEAEKLRDQRNQLILEKTEQFIQVAKGIGNAIYFAAETMAINDPDVLEHGGLQAQQKWHERNELIKNAAVEYLKDKTPYDAVKDTTHLIADFVLIGKMLHAFGHLSAGIARESKGLRSLEGAASLLSEELSVEKVFEEILETTRALESTTPEGLKIQTLVEFMQAESAIAQAANIVVRQAKVVFDEVRDIYKGVIPFQRKDLKDELTIILKEIQSSIKCSTSEKIKRLHGQQMIDGKLVKPNFDHIFKFEFKIKESKQLGGYILQLKGGHVAEVWETLENLGLIKILEKNIL